MFAVSYVKLKTKDAKLQLKSERKGLIMERKFKRRSWKKMNKIKEKRKEESVRTLNLEKEIC